MLCLNSIDTIIIDIVSESIPHLKRGALNDFLLIMRAMGIYSEKQHNKTDNVYEFAKGSKIRFFSADNPDKLLGGGRDIAFLNEANILKLESYRQIAIRTRQKIFIDFNPADEQHWLYDEVQTREDCKYIHSTYLDNIKFLTPEQIREIEHLKNVDENFWRVYGKGLRGQSQELIYKQYELIDNFPYWLENYGYGLDFGFINSQTACDKIGIDEDKKVIYLDEMFYQTGMNNQDIINQLRKNNVKRTIVADCNEPKTIQEIRQAGFSIMAVEKGQDSVVYGINKMKQYNIKVTKRSLNIIKELRNYKWLKDKKTGQVLNQPVKAFDHALDAARYYVHMTTKYSKFYVGI